MIKNGKAIKYSNTVMASRRCRSEYGIPDKVLQADLVPDWSAAEVTTGVSVPNDRLVML